MRLSIALEHRFLRTPDGAIWTTNTYPYDFWQRYLSAFETVNVIARVEDTAGADSRWLRVDGHRVSLSAIPHYIGPLQYLLRRRAVWQALRMAIRDGDAAILRMPGTLGLHLSKILRVRGYPFGLEVVGDPYEVFAPGTLRHPMRPLFRHLFTFELKRACQAAAACLYVTHQALQARYPCAGTEHVASDVELPGAAFVQTARDDLEAWSEVPNVVFVGSMAQPYKGVDILLRAVSICKAQGLVLRLTLLGDGRCRAEYVELAGKLGISDWVRFVGHVPAGPEVLKFLDSAHLFVLPSRTEGLPRALAEAMARALPCIATRVGGVPELLDETDVVPAGDPAALAKKMAEVLTSPGRLATMSARNLATAREYGDDVLGCRRGRFYHAVRAATVDWMNAG